MINTILHQDTLSIPNLCLFIFYSPAPAKSVGNINLNSWNILFYFLLQKNLLLPVKSTSLSFSVVHCCACSPIPLLYVSFINKSSYILLLVVHRWLLSKRILEIDSKLDNISQKSIKMYYEIFRIMEVHFIVPRSKANKNRWKKS